MKINHKASQLGYIGLLDMNRTILYFWNIQNIFWDNKMTLQSLPWTNDTIFLIVHILQNVTLAWEDRQNLELTWPHEVILPNRRPNLNHLCAKRKTGSQISLFNVEIHILDQTVKIPSNITAC